MTKYPLLVEFDPTVAVEICANARTLGDRPAQSSHSGKLGESGFCAFWKSIEQAFDYLEQRQVGVAYGIADEIRVASRITGEDSLEPIKVFVDSIFAEMFRSA